MKPFPRAFFIIQTQRLAGLVCIHIERMVRTMEAALSRTGEEIEQIYARNVDTVYRVCFSFMKNKADTEDMVQEAFLKLISSNVSFSSAQHEKAWLIVTASNLCKNALKHWWRKHEDIDNCIELSKNQDFEASETRQAIMNLPNDYKTIVYMYYYEGYSTPEIAQLLDTAQTTIRSRLYRARKLLKIDLGGEYDGQIPHTQSV